MAPEVSHVYDVFIIDDDVAYRHALRDYALAIGLEARAFQKSPDLLDILTSRPHPRALIVDVILEPTVWKGEAIRDGFAVGDFARRNAFEGVIVFVTSLGGDDGDWAQTNSERFDAKIFQKATRDIETFLVSLAKGRNSQHAHE